MRLNDLEYHRFFSSIDHHHGLETKYDLSFCIIVDPPCFYYRAYMTFFGCFKVILLVKKAQKSASKNFWITWQFYFAFIAPSSSCFTALLIVYCIQSSKNLLRFYRWKFVHTHWLLMLVRGGSEERKKERERKTKRGVQREERDRDKNVQQSSEIDVFRKVRR